MLRKLIKHELRATSKIFLSLFAAVVALMGGFQMIFLVARLLTGRDDTHPLLALLFGLFSVLSAFALLAMMAVLVIVPVQRFYKNLLGDEGYLMFTLPATPAQQILSKLITALIWMFAGIIVCILAVLLFAWNLPDITAVPSIPASFQAQTGVSFYLALFLFGLFMLLVFANTYLHFYLCIASVVTTVFHLPAAVTSPLKDLSKFFIVMAMAAIGLNTNIVTLVKTGGKPIFMGLCCWIGIAGVSLLMQHVLGIW